MRTIRIGDTFLLPANVISFSRATKPAGIGGPAEEGVAVTTVAGLRLEFFGPGIWEAFQGWAAGDGEGRPGPGTGAPGAESVAARPRSAHEAR